MTRDLHGALRKAVVDAVRTPIGLCGGALAEVRPDGSMVSGCAFCWCARLDQPRPQGRADPGGPRTERGRLSRGYRIKSRGYRLKSRYSRGAAVGTAAVSLRAARSPSPDAIVVRCSLARAKTRSSFGSRQARAGATVDGAATSVAPPGIHPVMSGISSARSLSRTLSRTSRVSLGLPNASSCRRGPPRWACSHQSRCELAVCRRWRQRRQRNGKGNPEVPAALGRGRVPLPVSVTHPTAPPTRPQSHPGGGGLPARW